MDNFSATTGSFISCNGVAVRLMQRGKHEEAYNLLKMTISRLQSKVSASRRRKSRINFYEALREEKKTIVNDTSIYSMSVCTGKARAYFLQTQQNIFTFYTKAFVIDEELEDKEVSLSTIFTVLTYNMGMAQFIGSTLNGREVESIRIQHNIKVFEAAMKATNEVLDDPTLCSLVVALTFNLGYLHYLCYNFQEIREHLRLAVRLVTCPMCEESVPEDDYDFFYSSICMFADGGMQQLHLAPAA